MSWRWRNSINLGGGARTTMSTRGIGASWGLAGLRVGRSPTGSFWVSFTVPGTGISFFKYLSQQGSQTTQAPPQPQPVVTILPPIQHAPNTPLTANQRILEEIRNTKP